MGGKRGNDMKWGKTGKKEKKGEEGGRAGKEQNERRYESSDTEGLGENGKAKRMGKVEGSK